MKVKKRGLLFGSLISYLVLVLFFSGCVYYNENPTDGAYDVPVSLEGGTGRASVRSPARVNIRDGRISAILVWSSANYDYMIVDGNKYLPLDDERAFEGHSTFEIPIASMDDRIDVIGDTTAMSTPHEIKYTLRFDWSAITGDINMSDKKDIFDEDNAGKGFDEEDVSHITKLSDIHTMITGSGTVIPVNIIGPDGSVIDFGTEVKRDYAQMFSIARSDTGYSFIHIEGSGDFLLVPKGCDASEIKTTDAVDAVDSDPTDALILCKPISDIYLVSSSAMDICASIDEGLSDISFCALDRKDWRVDEAVTAIDAGTLTFAGKYSAPDYELLLAGKCGLAVENTMVYHKPEIIEKLTDLGIPVMVEVSSYEPHPLGRMEWIKVYGELTGRSDKAEAVFDEKVGGLGSILDGPTDEKEGQAPDTLSVAFFYVTSTGSVNVRKSGDYISRMIEMSGGEYIPKADEEDEENALSTVNMQMEAFYAGARDADILIYNGTVDGEIRSIDDLIKKDGLFYDFKAVKNGRVYTTDDNLYQRTMSIPELMIDLDRVFNDENVSDEDLVFLRCVK